MKKRIKKFIENEIGRLQKKRYEVLKEDSIRNINLDKTPEGWVITFNNIIISSPTNDSVRLLNDLYYIRSNYINIK